MKLLFFSRGRGRGHGVPDIAIAEELVRAAPDIEMQLVSYGTRAKTIVENGNYGIEVIDLGLREDNPIAETLVRSHEVISHSAPAPDPIVAHEEFGGASCGKKAKVPAIVLTDWFSPRMAFGLEALLCADEVIFMDDLGRAPRPGSASALNWILRSEKAS